MKAFRTITLELPIRSSLIFLRSRCLQPQVSMIAAARAFVYNVPILSSLTKPPLRLHQSPSGILLFRQTSWQKYETPKTAQCRVIAAPGNKCHEINTLQHSSVQAYSIA